METRGRLRPAIARRASTASSSVSAGSSASGPSLRIDAGTVRSRRSSIVGTPTTSSIAPMSCEPGPIWRVAKSSRISIESSERISVIGFGSCLWCMERTSCARAHLIVAGIDRLGRRQLRPANPEHRHRRSGQRIQCAFSRAIPDTPCRPPLPSVRRTRTRPGSESGRTTRHSSGRR